MARTLEIVKCCVCGNVVEVVHAGAGVLSCCGRMMTVFSDQTVDPASEECYPVVHRTDEGIKVTIGSDVHAVIDEDHHIQWIEIRTDRFLMRQFLSRGDSPEATFRINAMDVTARAYCTERGLCVEKTA
ncbi:MAG: desulfoferrodoxin FeS4 iron-binding domain-containing protein [Planctomycetes bacterium]|nr:desulfoferrodoxin FeS4 iron-binding domain-containing protein [Planctomycetota bacterium]